MRAHWIKQRQHACSTFQRKLPDAVGQWTCKRRWDRSALAFMHVYTQGTPQIENGFKLCLVSTSDGYVNTFFCSRWGCIYLETKEIGFGFPRESLVCFYRWISFGFHMLPWCVGSETVWMMTIHNILIEGSLEVKLPTIWTVEESEEKRSEERRCRCAKRWESRETLCFSNDLWLRRVEK